MDEKNWSALLSLISEDREELRACRSNLSTYTATFLSALITVLTASRGERPIIQTQEAITLAIGLLLIYSLFALIQFIGLRQTRAALNRREVLLLGNQCDELNHSKERIRLLYDNPENYSKKKHLNSDNGDMLFLWLIIGAVIASIILIVLANIFLN